MMIIFRKLKFYQRIAKARINKEIDNRSIISTDYASVFYQNMEEDPGPLMPEKIKKTSKNNKNVKKGRYISLKIT